MEDSLLSNGLEDGLGNAGDIYPAAVLDSEGGRDMTDFPDTNGTNGTGGSSQLEDVTLLKGEMVYSQEVATQRPEQPLKRSSEDVRSSARDWVVILT